MTTWTSRLYENEQDLEQMQALLMDGRKRTDDWRYWHVGELIFDFFMVDCHLNPQEYIRLWHNPEGKLVGYAILGEDPSFDCQVSPEYVGCGIETEALAWAERQLGDLPKPEAQPWGKDFVSGVRQDDARRIAFLEQHGFRRGEYTEVNMLRRLDEPIPETRAARGLPGALSQTRMRFQTGRPPSARCGSRGPWATSATRSTPASCGCPATSAIWISCPSRRRASSPPM